MAKFQVIARASGSDVNPVLRSFPDTCPQCHHAIDPRYIAGFQHDNNSELELALQCPRQDCHHLFIAYYKLDVPVVYASIGNQEPIMVPLGDIADLSFILERTAPAVFAPRLFSESILSISKDFIEIYNQAAQAEQMGLNQICGPGYRKSIEYLMKDYATAKNPALRDTITKKRLANVIADHVDDSKIKDMAARATWLGNDETHYERVWPDADIHDMKALIDLTLYWIESETITAAFIKKMPKPAK